MKNRETVNRKLEKLDHILINLQRIVNTQEPITTYKDNIEKAQTLLEEIQSFVSREPKSAYEQNSSVGR